MLALIYLQAWSVLLCTHIYIRMLQGVNAAYSVKGCVSNTVCVIIVTHVVMWFYANTEVPVAMAKSLYAVRAWPSPHLEILRVHPVMCQSEVAYHFAFSCKANRVIHH